MVETETKESSLTVLLAFKHVSPDREMRTAALSSTATAINANTHTTRLGPSGHDCVDRDANLGHQIAGGNRSACPKLESRTTQRTLC